MVNGGVGVNHNGENERDDFPPYQNTCFTKLATHHGMMQAIGVNPGLQ
jgi:hypothetical protein